MSSRFRFSSVSTERPNSLSSPNPLHFPAWDPTESRRTPASVPAAACAPIKQSSFCEIHKNSPVTVTHELFHERTSRAEARCFVSVHHRHRGGLHAAVRPRQPRLRAAFDAEEIGGGGGGQWQGDSGPGVSCRLQQSASVLQDPGKQHSKLSGPTIGNPPTGPRST